MRDSVSRDLSALLERDGGMRVLRPRQSLLQRLDAKRLFGRMYLTTVQANERFP